MFFMKETRYCHGNSTDTWCMLVVV